MSLILAVGGLLLALGALVAIALKLRAARAEAAEVRNDAAALARSVSELQAKNRTLARYEGIVDVEAHAAKVLADAAAAGQAVEVAAKQEADRARAELREGRARAEAAIEASRAEAERIVAAAKKQAEEIAGDAYRALEEGKRIEETARAMRNVIEGYGDQYLVPTYGLLDELADDFGYAEAGQRLKVARDEVRKMIKTQTAATCEYAEEKRRATAIEFVLDAFNGKVESILCDVKHDNFGTLEQKIRDAYNLVNHNGAAFRSARILPEYLKARLEELRWAVTAQELKQQEKEEQRAIKEQMREEERVQREAERARREAEKEEEIVRRAMNKAQQDLEKATDEQKQKYELQLAELAEKLRVAEEKGQRAISMAEQTRAGHVYVISNIGSFGEHVYKIGMTRRLEPRERIDELGDASVPFDFDVHALIKSDDAPSLEKMLHKKFLQQQINKVNPRKEFFRLTIHEIREAVEGAGMSVAWTMAAVAEEYRETLAIEATLAKNGQGEAWTKRQLHEIETAPVASARSEAAAET